MVLRDHLEVRLRAARHGEDALCLNAAVPPQYRTQADSYLSRARPGVYEGVEHLAQLLTQRDGVWYATRGVAQMRNLAMTH
jgi:hypothetical protein